MADLHLQDGHKMHDEKEFTEAVAKKKSGSFYHTDVEFSNEHGEVLFRKSNIIVIGGRRFTLEKLFNISPSADRYFTLNQLFQTNTEQNPLEGKGPRREKAVCLFGVGRGGSDLTFGSVKNPAAKEYNLYDQIPFRFMDANDDIKGEEQNKYAMRVEREGNVSYYLKKFEVEPKLVMKVGDQEYVPDVNDNTPIDSSVSGILQREDVEVYVELKLKISPEDVREFFINTEGLEQSRINELALFAGYQPEHEKGVFTDFLDVECFSKLTFNNEPLDSESKELNIVYRIYI